MIDSMLISMAIGSGTVQFEERQGDYRMFASMLGMKVTLATLSKKQLAQVLAQTADGSVAPVQPVETRAATETPPAAVPESPRTPPVRQRPNLRLVSNE